MKEFNIKQEIHSLQKPFFILDTNTLMIIDVNAAAQGLLEYSKVELLKMHVFDLAAEHELENARTNATLYKNQKMYFTGTVYMKKSGELIKVRIAAHRISFNDKDCWQVEIKTTQK